MYIQFFLVQLYTAKDNQERFSNSLELFGRIIMNALKTVFAKSSGS